MIAGTVSIYVRFRFKIKLYALRVKKRVFRKVFFYELMLAGIVSIYVRCRFKIVCTQLE